MRGATRAGASAAPTLKSVEDKPSKTSQGPGHRIGREDQAGKLDWNAECTHQRPGGRDRCQGRPGRDSGQPHGLRGRSDHVERRQRENPAPPRSKLRVKGSDSTVWILDTPKLNLCSLGLGNDSVKPRALVCITSEQNLGAVRNRETPQRCPGEWEDASMYVLLFYLTQTPEWSRVVKNRILHSDWEQTLFWESRFLNPVLI